MEEKQLFWGKWHGGNGRSLAHFGVTVMYALYLHEKGLKNISKDVANNCYNIVSNGITIKNVFNDRCSTRRFPNPKFKYNDKILYCSNAWQDMTHHKYDDNPNYPIIQDLQKLLETCYKDVFRIENRDNSWYFYGPAEYLDKLDFKEKGDEDGSEITKKYDSDDSNVVNMEKEVGRNILLYGAPGTGKSYTAKQIVNNNAKGDKTCKELKLDNMPAGKSVRVTFHPDTDYASFVGCYKPSMNGKEIEYKFVPQAFLKIYVDAWKNLISGENIQQYYLVIEELNRGNCAQIFGDIFQLLDRKDNDGYSDYYIWADTDVVKYLKSEEGFGNNYEKYCGELEKVYVELKKDVNKDSGVLALPSNLTILATMNTSDQSLFPIDSAFKRRWEWKYVRINYVADDLNDVKLWDGTGWLGFIKEINKYIANKTHSADKQIGERFIKLPKNNKTIDYETFRDKVMFYLFNDVFKDDVEFGRAVFGDSGDNALFEDLFNENDCGENIVKKFIEKECSKEKGNEEIESF